MYSCLHIYMRMYNPRKTTDPSVSPPGGRMRGADISVSKYTLSLKVVCACPTGLGPYLEDPEQTTLGEKVGLSYALDSPSSTCRGSPKRRPN